MIASAVAPANPAITEPPPSRRSLRGIRLDDRLTHRDLAVAGDHDLTALAQAEDRRAVPAGLGGMIHASLQEHQGT